MHSQAQEPRCDGAVEWPELEGIVVRGLSGAVNAGAVTLRVLPGGTGQCHAQTTLTAEQVGLQGSPRDES